MCLGEVSSPPQRWHRYRSHALSGLVQQCLCLAPSPPPSPRPRLTHHLRRDRGPTTVGHHTSRLRGRLKRQLRCGSSFPTSPRCPRKPSRTSPTPCHTGDLVTRSRHHLRRNPYCRPLRTPAGCTNLAARSPSPTSRCPPARCSATRIAPPGSLVGVLHEAIVPHWSASCSPFTPIEPERRRPPPGLLPTPGAALRVPVDGASRQ